MSLAVQCFGTDPLLVCVAFCVAISEASLLWVAFTKLGGVFARAVNPPGKIVSLEGLRGILAFSVVVHHGCCWYFYSHTGVWQTGSSIIFARLGSFGVMQFFYLSGYLFWRKLMRKGRIDVGRFYLSRFVRIGPVYYVCAGTAILIGCMVHGFGLQVPLAELARSLASWVFFCLGGLASVNGADTLRVIAGVTWTLAMEWGFYLLLPFLGWFSRQARRLIWLALACGTVFVLARHASGALSNAPYLRAFTVQMWTLSKFLLIGFGGGILVAVLQPKLRVLNRLSAAQSSWALLGCYAAYLLMPDTGRAGQIFLLCGFALVVQGADLFGLITSRGMRLLGIISYDIYLVHGIVYYVASRLRGGHPVPLKAYLPETLLCIVVVLLLSTALHLAVERPTMLLSEKIARGSKEDAAPPKLVTVAAIVE